MQKVQKTYTAEFKREAVHLAQTSGKPIAQVARELGIDFHVHSPMAQGISRAWQRSVSGQWASDREGARNCADSNENWRGRKRSVT